MISNEAKSILENNIGLPLEQLQNLSFNDEINLIKAKTGKAPVFSSDLDFRNLGRGNALLVRGKFATIEEINEKIDAVRK